jgi:hypothetical protein
MTNAYMPQEEEEEKRKEKKYELIRSGSTSAEYHTS